MSEQRVCEVSALKEVCWKRESNVEGNVLGDSRFVCSCYCPSPLLKTKMMKYNPRLIGLSGHICLSFCLPV